MDSPTDDLRFRLEDGLEPLTTQREDWDALAALRPSPFLTHAWLSAWAACRAQGRMMCATLTDRSGRLRAGGVFQQVRRGLAWAGDVHSGDWGVVAASADDGRRLWDELARLHLPRLVLGGLRSGEPEPGVAEAAFRREAYGVLHTVRATPSPYLELPGAFDDLLGMRSPNLRSQWRRKARSIERTGRARFRVVCDGRTLARDLDALLRVEASGWKGAGDSAIVSSASTERLYRSFAAEAAERGWLRLYLLELDDEVIAADLGCAIGGVGFLLKTGFDQRHSRHSPGLVLRGQVLRVSIEEGLHGYDFLGGAEAYKLRWTDQLRPRVGLRLYGGSAGRLGERAWEAAARPSLVRLRQYVHEHPELRRRLRREVGSHNGQGATSQPRRPGAEPGRRGGGR